MTKLSFKPLDEMKECDGYGKKLASDNEHRY